MSTVVIAPGIDAADAVDAYRQKEIGIPDTMGCGESPLQFQRELMIVVLLPLLVTVVAFLGPFFCHFFMLTGVLILILQGIKRVGSKPEIAELGIIVGIVDRAREEALTIIIGGVDGCIIVVDGLFRTLIFSTALVGTSDVCLHLLALVVKLDTG